MTTGATDTTTGAGVSFSDGETAPATTGAGSSGDNTSTSQTTAPTTPPAGSAAGTSGTTPAYYETIQDTALRDFAKGKGFDTAEKALKSYQELEATFSARTAATSAPADAKDYSFAPPENAKDIGYSDEFASWFRNAAHKGKVPDAFAKHIHDEYVNYAAAQAQAHQTAQATALQTSVQKTAGDLEMAWGAQGTPTFNQNMEMARRAIRMSDPGLMADLRAAGILTKGADGREVATSPAIFKALAKMGAGMYAEDKYDGGSASSKNPFDDKTVDLAMQGRMIRSEPEKAALLIRAAGKEKMFSGFLNGRK